MMIGTKWFFGRSRPSATPSDPTRFDWFDGDDSAAFPSGSAAVVFSLATTLADAIDRKPVSVLLYGGAVLNAWARLYSDRHWLTDVTLGALYGITAAKLVNGEWTVFGLEWPAVWTDGRSLSLGYTLAR
jgi:membrane-associated phospholipid phosphatase